MVKTDFVIIINDVMRGIEKYSVKLSIFILVGLFGCQNEQEDLLHTYDFSGDQFHQIKSEDVLPLLRDIESKLKSPASRSEGSEYMLQEALFLAEGTVNYIQGKPEHVDSRNFISFSNQFSFESFDVSGGKAVLEEELISLIERVLDKVTLLRPEAYGLYLADFNIVDVQGNEVLIEVTAEFSLLDINWIDTFDLFVDDSNYYSIYAITPFGGVESGGCYSGGDLGNGCSLFDSDTPSHKLINKELQEYYFPLEQKEQGYTFVNLTVNTIISHSSSSNLIDNQINCTPGWEATWGCVDWLWQGEGQYYNGYSYPHCSVSELVTCVSGERMNNYMEKVQTYLAWRITVNQIQGNSINAVAKLDYHKFCTQTNPGQANTQFYVMGHKFVYRLGQKIFSE